MTRLETFPVKRAHALDVVLTPADTYLPSLSGSGTDELVPDIGISWNRLWASAEGYNTFD